MHHCSCCIHSLAILVFQTWKAEKAHVPVHETSYSCHSRYGYNILQYKLHIHVHLVYHIHPNIDICHCQIMIRGCRHFHRYQTTTHFICEYRHDKGPFTTVALELSTMSEIIHVHIAHLNIPITRLSVHEIDHNAYYILSGNWFYDFLKLSQPIILLHRNGVIPTHSPITFEIRFFQSFKLCHILCTDYLARVVAFQNGYMIALSRIQVCHSANTLVAATSNPEPVQHLVDYTHLTPYPNI